jgi:hypothetical protein
MTISEQLRQYNRWRRGDESVPMPHPKALGELIERAADRLEVLEAAARNLVEQKGRHNTEVAYKRLAELVRKA